MKDVLLKVVKYLLKKPNYLKKSVWFLIVALVREVAAISTHQDIIDLSHELQVNTSLSGWSRFGIKAIEVILFGGSWFVFIMLLALLLFVSTLLVITRKKKSMVVIGSHHFDSQLSNIESSFIETFRSRSAKELTKSLLTEIDRSYLSPEDKLRLRAKAQYVLGKCRSDQEDPNEGYKYLVKAYELEPTNFEYKERACISYFFLDKKEDALRLANELLSEDPDCQRAMAIKAGNDSGLPLTKVKANILSGHAFRRLYALVLAHRGDQAGVLSFLQPEFKEKKLPPTLEFKNIDYWEVVARFSFYASTHDLKGFVHEKQDNTGNELLRYSHKLLQMIHDTIVHTEAAEMVGYQTTLYYYHYADYLLTYNKTSVTSMRKLNEKLPEHMKIRHRDELLFALNQSGQFNEALEVSQEMNVETDSFVANMRYIAYRGLDKIEQAEAAFSKYCQALAAIDEQTVNNILAFFNDYRDAPARYRVPDVYQAIIEPLKFVNNDEKRLVFCYAHRYLPDYTNAIAKELPEIILNFEKLRAEMQHVALIVV